MTYTLRPYQESAVEAAFGHLGGAFRTDKHGLLVLPTGAGKSIVIAELVRRILLDDSRARVVCLTHVKELVAQNAEKAEALLGQEQVGVYSAGLGRRETGRALVVGAVQSCFRDPSVFGHVHLLLVDEAHRIPRHGEGMYRRVIDGMREANPDLLILGLTATPFRADGTGYLHDGPGALFKEIVYEVGILELVHGGFLAPLTTRGSSVAYDVSGVSTRGGDYAKGELEQAIASQDDVTRAALVEAAERARDRRSWLVFAASVGHAHRCAEILGELGVEAGVVTGETDPQERAKLVERFRDGSLRALVNVFVLTTGFDAPETDCLVLMRPTQSAVLWVQMCGRGMRIAPGKRDCLVLDYGGNAMRLGLVTDPHVKTSKGTGDAPVKKCPECEALVPTAKRVCPSCEHVFPPRRVEIQSTADDAPVMLRGDETDEWEVVETTYHSHVSHASGSRTMRASYRVGMMTSYSEWVCFEHDGFAGHKARKWWRDRGGERPEPLTVQEALERTGELWEPARIRVKLERNKDGKAFPRVVDAEPYRPTQEEIDECPF